MTGNMTYKDFVQKYIAERMNKGKFICSGCGQSYHLSVSHLIKRSKRKDLECDKRNVTLHCLSIGKKGCHEIWESNRFEEMINLKDFWDNMKAIKSLDINHFNFILSRFKRQNINDELIKIMEVL